jgi:hypothetical protein
MKVLVRIHAGRNLFLSFSVFEASLIVEGSTISKSLNRFLKRGRGDRCMKDTVHPISHPRVHLGRRAIASRRRVCARENAQFGRGQNTELGWSNPTFAHGSVAKVMFGVAPALAEISGGVLPACIAGFQTKPVKNVRITLCTFKLATSSPDAQRTELVLKDLRKPNPRNLPHKTGQIGRERPHFFAVNPPKSFWGSLPPARSLRSKPHGERE